MSMMKTRKNFPGKDGFVWWTGVVEGRKDPLKTGRVQIRIFGWHSDSKNMVPSGELLWAQPVMAANAYDRTSVPREGEVLFGFFMDGEDAQFPFYLGVIPNIPEKLYPPNVGFSDPGDRLGERPSKVASRTMIDGEGVKISSASAKRYPDELNQPTTSKLARNEYPEKTPLKFISENIIKGVETAGGRTWDETDPDYGAEYPYNASIQSESGHYVDIDDTKNKERITSMHRTGSMDEMRHTGSWHKKAIKHLISLVHGSDVSNIRGNLWKTVERWTRFRSKGRTLVEINADTKINIGGNLNINVDKDIVINCSGKIFIGALGADNSSPTGKTCGDDDIKTVSDVTSCQQSVILYGKNDVATFPELYTKLAHCHITGNAVAAGYALTAGSAPDGDANVLEGVAASDPGANIDPEKVEYKNADEVPIDEVKAYCGSGKKKTPEEIRKEKLEALLAAITAPNGGGAGAKWCGKMPDGTEQCVSTHHATSDADIIAYFTCIGATSITGHENSTGITTPYNPTACPF